jgi:DNA phosphorothioation-associated putative methyltransferase
MANSSKNIEIERHKTALHRVALSRPLATALGDGLIIKSRTIFDYGCGRGADIKLLDRRGHKISGWDPHFHPEGIRAKADIVNLGYVLNVIEDPDERRETLKEAFNLAQKLLIVAVRVDRSLQSDIEHEDGIVSSIKTFQKLYSQSEFKEYVESILGVKPQTASIGVVYIFKDEELCTEFVARRSYGSTGVVQLDLIDEFGKDRTAKQFIKKTEELGRYPLALEFAKIDELIDFYGSVDRVYKYAAFYLDLKRLDLVKKDRRSDVLTFLASLRLRGMTLPKVSSLPANVRADIKAIWPSYTDAKADAMSFLYSLGDRESVAAAIKGFPYGKKLPEDFYVHASLENELPALVRLVIFAAKNIIGATQYNVLKIRVSGRAVSFMQYENFDHDPHPKLKHSVIAYLPKSDYSIRSYQDSKNRPILHRKDAFVSEEYPLYERFRHLTLEEEKLGVLGLPNIGYEEKWEDLLKSRKLKIQEHNISRI